MAQNSWTRSSALDATNCGSPDTALNRSSTQGGTFDPNQIDANDHGASLVRNICCVGAGYVGGPTSAIIAYHHPLIHVTVVDKSELRISQWRSKHLPIDEHGLQHLVRVARDGLRTCPTVEMKIPDNLPEFDTGPTLPSTRHDETLRYQGNSLSHSSRSPNLVFSTDVEQSIAQADIVLVAVDTPTKLKGTGAGKAPDMTAFNSVVSVIAQFARPGSIIVERSTVPCKTAQLVKKTLETQRPGVPFDVLSNPEFLAAGTTIHNLKFPDRVLIGASNTASGHRAANVLASIYAKWVPQSRIITTNIWSSELSKIVANSMLAQRISSINSISAICEKTGADVKEVAASIGHDSRIGTKYLQAGLGFGGSCLKKDTLSLVYLAESLGLDEVSEYWQQVIKMNEYRKDLFVFRLLKCLNNTLTGKKITLLGFSFKGNTADTRDTPALHVIEKLLAEAPGQIAIFDPYCGSVAIEKEIKDLMNTYGTHITTHDNVYEACASSNAVLVVTDHDEFRNISAEAPLYFGASMFQRPTETDQADASFSKKAFHMPDSFAPHISVDVSAVAIEDMYKYHVLEYAEEPPCAQECDRCRLARETGSKQLGFNCNREKNMVDWYKISQTLAEPKLVLDGKGILDSQVMSDMGIWFEGVGRPGSGLQMATY